MQSSDTWQIYILELAEGKWYVGKSKNPAERFIQHLNGEGAAWTKKYEPQNMVKSFPMTSEYDEDNYTKQYMKTHGIANVRGGSYCQVVLPSDTYRLLQKELEGAGDLCYKCHQPGHYANRCPLNSNCRFCKKTGHIMRDCPIRNAKPKCPRCGRPEHGKCIWKTRVDGTYLTDTRSVNWAEFTEEPDPAPEPEPEPLIKFDEVPVMSPAALSPAALSPAASGSDILGSDVPPGLATPIAPTPTSTSVSTTDIKKSEKTGINCVIS